MAQTAYEYHTIDEDGYLWYHIVRLGATKPKSSRLRKATKQDKEIYGQETNGKG